MEDIRKFLPTGPNFGALSGLGEAVAFVLGVILALATLAAIIAFFVNLAKLGFALISSNAIKVNHAGKATGISLGFFLVLAILWGVLLTAVVNFGSSVPGT